MRAADKKGEKIRFREVYLSDLKSVMDLYRNSLSRATNTNVSESKLTADFGLPIGIAEQNGKVIAYSHVNIDSTGKPVFLIHNNGAAEADGICENLSHFSVARFTAIWGNNTRPDLLGKPVGNAIDRLVNWLNNCN